MPPENSAVFAGIISSKISQLITVLSLLLVLVFFQVPSCSVRDTLSFLQLASQ